MCGINGFTFSDQSLIQEMNRVTKHRGPDATNFWVGDGVSLGHNRLAIIDLSPRGQMPMWDSAREVVIVYNGEIYNYLALREELKRDYDFQSESDTEVILAAYHKYGIECVKRLNGIFAFALWDTRTRELWLARDHVGVNPLYYYQDGGRLIFSSEIKAILAHRDVPRVVDKEAFNLFFQLLYVPEPHTMFTGIKKLPPAHYARFKNGALTLTRYWQLADFSDLNSRPEAVHLVRKTFQDSVKRQLVSDRPVGVFLSGGLDSTAVLGRVAEVASGSVKTFSVGFKESVQPDKFNADFELARRTAKHYGTDHHELLIGPDDLHAHLEKIVWHLDEPNANATAGAMFLLSEMAKRDVAVVLGGDGGDELFGGYPRYFYSRLVSAYQEWPSFVQNISRGLLSVLARSGDAAKLRLPPGAQRVAAFLAQKTDMVAQAIRPEVFAGAAAVNYLQKKFFLGNSLFGQAALAKDFEKIFMHVDRQSWLVDESLLRTNKMCMAFGLEPRVPMLDLRLVELANRIPTAWKFSLWQRPSAFQGKALWREAVRDYIPAHVLDERKRGWFTPISKWLRTPLFRSYAGEVLAPGRLHEWFNQPAVEKIWREHLDGRVYNLNIIWAVVMWQLWYERFIKSKV